MSNKDRPTRGRSNSDERGSSLQRRRRKQWLLDHFGDGTTAPCQAPLAHGGVCGNPVTFVSMIVGRIIPGVHGGRYRRDNIRPECGKCSTTEGGQRHTGNDARGRAAAVVAEAASVVAGAVAAMVGTGECPDCSCGTLQRHCPACSGAV